MYCTFIHSFSHLLLCLSTQQEGSVSKKLDTQQSCMLIEFTDFYIMPKLEEFAHDKTNTLFGFYEQILNILKGFQ